MRLPARNLVGLVVETLRRAARDPGPVCRCVASRGNVIELCGALAGAAMFFIVLRTLPTSASPARIAWVIALALLAAPLIVRAPFRWLERGNAGGLAPDHAASAGRSVILLLAFVLAALPLSQAWHSGRGGFFAPGGALPWSDASNWYSGAVLLSEYKILDTWNERRPINAAVNSLKLRLGGSLRGWVTASALLLAVGMGLLGREIACRIGPAAAAAVLATITGHGPEYWASTMSETNGLLFGLFATSVLLSAMRLRSDVLLCVGLFLLVLALDARAGAFLILPLLWAWGMFLHRKTAKRRLAFALITMLSMALAFAPARIYATLWGSAHGRVHGNFAWTLYGIAAGNQGWLQVFRDHPEIADLADERQQAQFAYQRAFELIQAEPVRFTKAIARSIAIFLEDGGAFFLKQGTGLTIVALLLSAIRWRDRLSTLFLCAFAGTALSAPFLIWDASPRVFAATIPMTALGVGVVVRFLQVVLLDLVGFSRTPPSSEEPPPASVAGHRSVPAIAMFVTLLMLVVPSFMPASKVRDALPNTLGLSGQRDSILFVPGSSGEWLDVVGDDQPRRTGVSRQSDLASDLRHTQLAGLFEMKSPPFSFGLGVMNQVPPERWFATHSGVLLPRQERPLLLVGNRQSSRGFPFLVVNEAFVLSEGRWQRLMMTGGAKFNH